MNIGIIGSGGREHSICVSINKSKKVKKIYCFPGNAGTAKIAQNININIGNFDEIREHVKKKKIDLLVIGPEKPLVDGITDFFKDDEVLIFGPNKICSQLEGSKIFTKKICEKYKIPTAKFGIFKNKKDAFHYVKSCNFPLVVKADGLASGKGVYICENISNANTAIKEIFNGKFGLAKNILIEEFLSGEEMSFFILSDGKKIINFQTAQDHKRALEGDKGKNTGGMGAYSPSKLNSHDLESKIKKKIILPTLKAIKELGTKYVGFLYAGLMIVENEPYLIEYNVRMGDPECQTILPRLKTDLLDLMISCCKGKLKKKISWKKEKSLCIVLCAKGYPEKYLKKEIKNLHKLKTNQGDYIYHAGTINKNGKIFSNGGRVINAVCLSNEFKICREKSLNLLNKLKWKNGFFRKDIGYKVIYK